MSAHSVPASVPDANALSSPLRLRAEKLQWLLCLLLMTLVFLFNNWPLASGRAAGLFDIDQATLPYYILVADHARAGQLVGWDPWTQAGLPAFSDPQVGALSPITVLFAWLTGPTTHGFVIYWLTVWWLGGVGVLLLGRQLKAPAWGSCIVALGFLFSGIYEGQAQHTSHIMSYTFLPLILWRIEAAMARRSLRAAAEAGALWGLSAMAGYPGYTIVTAAFLACWVLGRWRYPAEQTGQPVHGERSGTPVRPSWRFMIGLSASALLVGVVVLLPTYLGFLREGFVVHGRAGALPPDDAVWLNTYEIGALSTLFTPYAGVLSLLNVGYLWPRTDPTCASAFVGSLVLAFSILAILLQPKNRWRWYLLLVGLIFLTAAIPSVFLTRQYLYDYLPPMRYFRQTHLFRAYFMLTLVVLALLATRDLQSMLQQGSKRAGRRLLVLSLVLGALALAAIAVLSRRVHNVDGLQGAWLHCVLIWAGMAGAAILLIKPNRLLARIFITSLILLAVADAACTAAFMKPMVYTKNVERWRQLEAHHSSSLTLTDSKRTFDQPEIPGLPRVEHNNDQMILKTPVLWAYATLVNVYYGAIVLDPYLSQMVLSPSRLWFSEEALSIVPDEPALKQFVKTAPATKTWPILIHSTQQVLDSRNPRHQPDLKAVERIASLPGAKPIDSHIRHYEPNRLVLDFESPSDGWLLITERWARSWKAHLDGKSVPIHVGNFAFRAIQVTKGKHHLEFHYDLRHIKLLLVLSWGTLAALVILAVVGSLRRNDPAVPSPSE